MLNWHLSAQVLQHYELTHQAFQTYLERYLEALDNFQE